MQKITRQLADEIKISLPQVLSAVALLDGGATVPFIARYRKEVTGGLDDIQLRELEARLSYLRESSKSAEEAASLARQRYKDGVANFLDVLDAERVALQAQNDAVASQVRAATAWVTVNKAMGR